MPVIERCQSIAREHGIPCRQKGLRLDSHVHTHLVPVVWQALLRCLEEERYEVEYLRNPKEPLFPFLKQKTLWKTYRPINFIKNRILMLLSGKADRFCKEHQLPETYLWGLLMSGKMDSDRIKYIYPQMCSYADQKERYLEILFHPGMVREEEKTDEMDPVSCAAFNASGNRHIEKEAVLQIRKSR